LIILGALFSPLDWFLLHLVTLFLWPSVFLINLFLVIKIRWLNAIKISPKEKIKHPK
jgi:hypothetical protein